MKLEDQMTSIQNCGKCGLCLSFCPVYNELKMEHASPRARLRLIKSYEEQDLISSPQMQQIISKCLMCGSCAAMCPSGVNHYAQFMEMRKKMAETHGEAPPIKALTWLLAKEYRLKNAEKMAKAGQKLIPLFPEKFKEKYKIGNIALNHLPQFNPTPFREALPEIIESEATAKGTEADGSIKKIKTDKITKETGKSEKAGKAKKSTVGTVIYFTGCATNYLFDDTGFSTVELLKKMGYRVIIPKAQTCCSIPMLFHGAVDESRHNIETNIKALDQALQQQQNNLEPEAILVDCATCGSALKKEYPAFLSPSKLNSPKEYDHALHEAAQKIADKTVDLLSFIQGKMEDLIKESNGANRMNGANDEKTVVTYHAPCHLKNSPTGFGHVEHLLNALPTVEYQSSADTDKCCGGGGTFFYEYPDLSQKMVQRKIDNAVKTDAALWLTDCPVCRINLSGNMTPNALPVIHPITLIHEVLTP